MPPSTADFDAFYQASARRVVLYLYAVCGDLADAQDIAQEAYARAWQHWPKVSSYDNPEGWVRATGWRLAANRWRGLRRRWAAQARMGPPEVATASPSPDRVAVVTALQRLPGSAPGGGPALPARHVGERHRAAHRRPGRTRQSPAVPGPYRARRAPRRPPAGGQ